MARGRGGEEGWVSGNHGQVTHSTLSMFSVQGTYPGSCTGLFHGLMRFQDRLSHICIILYLCCLSTLCWRISQLIASSTLALNCCVDKSQVSGTMRIISSEMPPSSRPFHFFLGDFVKDGLLRVKRDPNSRSGDMAWFMDLPQNSVVVLDKVAFCESQIRTWEIVPTISNAHSALVASKHLLS